MSIVDFFAKGAGSLASFGKTLASNLSWDTFGRTCIFPSKFDSPERKGIRRALLWKFCLRFTGTHEYKQENQKENGLNKKLFNGKGKGHFLEVTESVNDSGER